jgi:hypothetical protein
LHPKARVCRQGPKAKHKKHKQCCAEACKHKQKSNIFTNNLKGSLPDGEKHKITIMQFAQNEKQMNKNHIFSPINSITSEYAMFLMRILLSGLGFSIAVNLYTIKGIDTR